MIVRWSTMARRDAFKAADFTRMAIAVAVAGVWNAAEYARVRWGDDELSEVIHRSIAMQIRAPVPPMATDDGAGGSNFITRFEYLANEFIELLRPMLIVGRMPSMRRLNFNNNGSLLIPRQTGGVAGGYVGEGAPIAVNRLAFNQMTLTPSKLAVIVPQTHELLRRSDPPTEQLIRDDMLQGTARTIDNFFFSTIAAVANPAGILNGIPPNAGGAIPPAALALAVTSVRNRSAQEHDPCPADAERADARAGLDHERADEGIPALAPHDAGYLRVQGGDRCRHLARLSGDELDLDRDPVPTGHRDADRLCSGRCVATDLGRRHGRDDRRVAGSFDPTRRRADEPAGRRRRCSGRRSRPTWCLMRLRMSHTWARRHDVAVAWALTDE